MPPAAVALTLLAAAGTAWAGPGELGTPTLGLRPQAVAERAPMPKKPTDQLRLPHDGTGKLIVKFVDELKARAMPDGSVRSGPVDPIAEANVLLDEYGISFVKLLNHSDQTLARLEARAAAFSGEAQPDLAGMMLVEDFRSDREMLEVARYLNDLDIVEYVEFQFNIRAAGGGGDPADPFGSQILTSGPLVDAAKDLYLVDELIIASLAVPQTPGESAVILGVPLGELTVTLSLDPHSVRSGGYQLYSAAADRSLTALNVGIERNVRGSAMGLDGSVVAGAILDSGFFGTVKLTDGSQYWIHPVAGDIEGAAPGQHVVYEATDIAGPFGICGTADGAVLNAGGGGQPGAQGGVAGDEICYTEIAIHLEPEWVAKAAAPGDDSELAKAKGAQLAAAVVNIANIQYETEVGISHVLTAVIADDESYTNTDASQLLTEFTLDWNLNRGSIQRDVAHLFTGKNLDGSVLGVAWTGTVCSSDTHYSLSQRVSTFACQTDLLAHELGHNWNASHCSCDGDTFDDRFTMNSYITCANTFHPIFTQPTITSFRDSRPCLDCGSPPPGCGITGQLCTSVHATPYCNDPICCATVCAIDPLCCEEAGPGDNAWDEGCVALAMEYCFECGDADAGDCYEANFTPACDDPDCCELVSSLGDCCVTSMEGEITCFIATLAACDASGGEWTDYGCGEGVWDERCAILAGLSCGQDVLGGTPDLTAFQGYRTAAATPGFEVLSRAVMGTETFMGEGLDLDEVWAFGQDLLDNGIGSTNGAGGHGIKVAVIEPAAYVDHEDLNDVNVEAGQTIWLTPTNEPEHGTAVLGIIGANADNDIGMKGLAPDAELWFFPSFSLEEGARFESAIISAMLELGPGDVINFSVAPDNENEDGDCTVGLLTNNLAIAQLVNQAQGLGITSVVAAGDDCCNLDDVAITGGAWVVGGVDPGRKFCRRPQSNHSGETDTGAILPPDISGWGEVVATLGGNGDLYGPAANPRRVYTSSFSGTSAATPMVSSSIARMQGIARQVYGIPLQPWQIRAARRGIPQCEITDPDDLPGTPDGEECMGDFAEPGEEDPNRVGPFPALRPWAETIVNTPWFGSAGSSLVEDVLQIHGNHLLGNLLSIRNFDGILYINESRYTLAGEHPINFVPPTSSFNPDMVNSITYIANGHVSDMLVYARANVDRLNDLFVGVAGSSTNTSGWLFIEAYDWNSGVFRLASVTPGYDFLLPLGIPLNIARPQRYMNANKEIVLRFWTWGFATTSLGSGTPEAPIENTFLDLWDIIVVQTFAGPGEVGPP